MKYAQDSSAGSAGCLKRKRGGAGVRVSQQCRTPGTSLSLVHISVPPTSVFANLVTTVDLGPKAMDLFSGIHFVACVIDSLMT